MEHNKTMIKGTPTAPVSDPKILQYAEGINSNLDDEPQDDPSTAEINKKLKELAMNANPSNGDGMAVAFHRFAGALEKETEAKQMKRSAKKLEKDNKEWDKLPTLNQNIIEGAQIRYFYPEIDKEDIDDNEYMSYILPKGLTKHMKAVLQCNTGARFQQYLHHLMKKEKCLVEISVGMCTAMNNGMIAIQPSEQDINNYTLFCLPQQD